MRDRRAKRRRRVCLEGALSNDLRRPARIVRVRDLSDSGAQIFLGDPSPMVGQVAFSLARENGHIREAAVVWQRDEPGRLRFAAGETSTPDPLAGLLGRRGT